MSDIFTSDLRVPERLRPVLDKVSDLYTSEVAPREEQFRERLSNHLLYTDDEGKLHPELWQARREIMRAAGKAGIFAAHLPERIGGLELGREDMVYVEELVYSYGVGLNPALISWTDGATPRLLYCSDEQRAQFVDPLIRGEKSSFNGVTESEAGSNVFAMKTHAVQRGRDWVLNGSKAFITNAFGAEIGHVLAVTDPGQGRRSLTYFQFDVGEYRERGFRTGRVYQTMFHDGLTGEMFFDDMVLPESAVLGERGQGFDIFLGSVNWTRMRRGGMCSGWGRYLIERTIERAQSRSINGSPLGDKQGIQWMLADMYADWLSARSLSLAVAAAIDDPGPWWKIPRPQSEIRRICTLKLVNDEAFYRIADRALQVHGATGVLKDSGINKLFQIARNLRIPGGSDEVQRTTIAESFGLGRGNATSRPQLLRD